MVTVTNFFEVLKKDGTTFISLELSGGVELIQSQTTGNYYATVRRCRIPSTFDASVAKLMVGSRIPGEIIRVICEPYDYTNKRTGEVIRLQHSYAYRLSQHAELVGQTPVHEVA